LLHAIHSHSAITASDPHSPIPAGDKPSKSGGEYLNEVEEEVEHDINWGQDRECAECAEDGVADFRETGMQ
jgi:hypothetical protein